MRSRTWPTSVGAATALALDIMVLIWVARCARTVREVFVRNRLGKTEFTARATTLMPLSRVTWPSHVSVVGGDGTHQKIDAKMAVQQPLMVPHSDSRWIPDDRVERCVALRQSLYAYLMRQSGDRLDLWLDLDLTFTRCTCQSKSQKVQLEL